MPSYEYSVIVSFYNEAENVEALYNRLSHTFETIDGTVEYWFVDDGSSDQTFNVLTKLHEQESDVNVLKLSRNFGQHAALFAGLNHSRGAYTITMDGDLQDNPENIPFLIEEMKKGYDVVVTVRQNRHESILRKIAASTFWKLLNALSDRPIFPHQAFLRVFNQKVKQAILEFHEPLKFMAGIFSYVGFKQQAIVVDQGIRLQGHSKYNWSKLISQLFDAFLGFSEKPLRFLTYFGGSIVLLTIALFLVMAGLSLLNGMTFTLSWVVVSLFFCLGVLLFFMGIIAEFLARLYQNTLNRPQHIIDEKLVVSHETTTE